MKQKRKVKSLIPQKKFTSKSLKTAWLVFLWSALYLASITLLSTSVAFWANEWAQAKDFPEFDWNSPISDKSEVVYAARFATIDNLSNRIIDIFMNKNWVLYITPNPVIVNPLNVETNDISFSRNEVKWVYWHILWWDNNKVYSNNVTIIAWEENKVNTWSDNTTMLWWEKNTINQWIWVPSAIIWWSENTIESNHNWSNVIIWWNNNTIKKGVSGSAILWWELNTIGNNTTNAIIWWSNVTNDKNNVFAYSTDNFEPQNSNSFFLNMKKGVWINMEASGALNGLYVSGAVSLWDIDINKPCKDNNENYWLEWKYKWCLVGCTKDWWKMFDRGKKCETICKDNINIFKECPRDAAIPDSPDDYTGFCMGLANTDNATQCPNLEAEMQNYKNVVFETKLIDSERECPESEDKCIFQCDDNYHLLKDETWINSSTKWTKKCYEDCSLPRNPDEKRKTNEKIIAYNTTISYCATNVDEVYDNCGNHKEELVCYDWSRYYTKNKQKNNGHKYESCTLTWYICPDEYNYNLNEIGFKLKDYIAPNSTSQKKDRSTITIFTRWTYKLCLDYTPRVEENWEICDEKDNFEGPLHYEHYKLITCNSGYDLMNIDWIPRCMKRCTFDTSDNWPIEIKHGETKDLYSSSGANCPAICEKETFKCNDWKWENAEKMNTYKYDNCTLYNEKERDPSFNIDKQTYDYRFSKWYTKHTEYESQTISIVKNQNNECKDETKYKIVWCEDHYHISPTLKYCIKEWNRGECEPLVDYSHRTDSDDEPFQSTEFWTLYRYAGSTRAEKVWTSWDDPTTETRNKCHSDCDPGFTRRKTGWKNYCVKDWKCPTNPNGPQCPNGKNPDIIRSEQYWSSWTCPWQWVGSSSSDTCHFCADDYEWDGNVCYQCDDGEEWNGSECISVFNWQCYNDSTDDSWNNLSRNYIDSYYTLCKPWISIPGDYIKDDNGNIIGYTWDCQWQGSNTSSQEWCHKCEPWYTWEGGTCTKCNWTNCECIDCVTPVNGECNTETTINNRWPQNDKDLCTEWEPKHKNWPNDNKYTWDCIWTWGWTSENWCFRCKIWTILSGNKCINPTTNAECGTKSNGKYFTSLAHLMETNNLCDNWNYSTVDQVNNQFKWTCSDSVWSVTCSATKLECWSSSGQNYTSTSEIKNKCAPQSLNLNPTVTEDTNNNKFRWTCTKDDASIECTANKTNVVCKNKLIVKPNWWSIDGHTSDRTLEQDCGSTKKITNEQKSATTSTSSCYVYFYKDQNSSNFERETATINSTTKWSFDKWTDSSNCGWFNWSEYTFPWTNWTTCTKTAQWKVNTTTYTTWTVTVAPLEREWYVFLGWTWPKNYSTGTYSHTPASCGEKFYAQWRKIENGQCKNWVLYGCEVPSSSWTWKSDIIENGKIIWVKYECKWKDQTATCEYRCPSWKIFSGDTLHNGTCVKEELECVAGEWGEYDVTYPLPEDAKQNSNKYIVNRILPDFNIENDSNEWTYYQNETPIYYYNGQILTDWEYYGTDKSCAWTCADGYHINDKNNPTECIKDIVYPTCWVVKMGLQEGIHFYDQWIDWGWACPWDGDYLVAGSKNENWRMSENGCWEQAYTWTCRNNDSGLSKRCPYKKKMGYFDVHFQKWSSFDSTKLWEITISRQFWLGQFAFNVVFTDSYGNKSTVTLSAPGDVQSVNYDIKKSEWTPNTYYTNLDPYSKKVTYYIGGIQGSIEKIEFSEVTDQTYVIGAYKWIDAISFIKDSIWNSNCPGFDNTIYPYY